MSRRYSQDRLMVDEARPDAVVLPWFYATWMPEPFDYYLWHQWQSAWAEHTMTVCHNVWRHQGSKLYATHRDSELRADLQDWLWVTAVESAAHFVPDPSHPAPERQWAAWLYKNLTAKARYHFGQVVGSGHSGPGRDARAAHQRGIASSDFLDEREAETGAVFNRRPLHAEVFEQADPVSVIIRLEDLAESVRTVEAEDRRAGFYTTASTTCLVNLCTRPASGRGMCASHYNAERRDAIDRGDWAPYEANDACEVEDCDGEHHSKGLCRKHYERWRLTGSTDLVVRVCSVDGCDRKHRKNGYCAMHDQRVRTTGEVGPPGALVERQGEECTEDGCNRAPRSGGRCNKHYHQWRKANAAPCTQDGCDKPSATRGMCPGHYQQWRKARDTGEAPA